MLKPLVHFVGHLAVGVASAGFALAAQPAERVIVVGDRAHGTGEIAYSRDLTVSKVLIRIGGISDFSDTSVYLVRCGQVTRIDTRAIVQGGQPDKDVQLKPWDVIVIGPGFTRRQ
jgi:hypothetical protein